MSSGPFFEVPDALSFTPPYISAKVPDIIFDVIVAIDRKYGLFPRSNQGRYSHPHNNLAIDGVIVSDVERNYIVIILTGAYREVGRNLSTPLSAEEFYFS